MRKLIFLSVCLILFCVGLKAQVDNGIPISISSFDAATGVHTNKLIWKTACALDFANFSIQRSYNGTSYTTIHSFSADRFRCQQPFDYVDSVSNQISGRIFYRLKVGDIDGRIYHSKIVSLITRGEGIEINSFTPTIVSNQATVSISSSALDYASFKIVNIRGVVVQQNNIKLNKGVNSIQIRTDHFSTGKYWFSLVNSKNESRIISFQKQ